MCEILSWPLPSAAFEVGSGKAVIFVSERNIAKEKQVKAQSVAIKALKLHNCAQYEPLSSLHLLLCGVGVGDRQHLLALTVSGICVVSLSES